MADVTTNAKDAISGLDIVVTSIPKFSEPTRFLNGREVAEGAFVSMVDMGFGWDTATLGAFCRAAQTQFHPPLSL